MFYIGMVRPRHLLALVLGIASFATPAAAACTSPPGPGVEWRRCLLDGRDLRGANLAGASLRDSSLQRARLGRANLSRADAIDTRFVSADLTGADFSNATLDGARWTDGARICAAGSIGTCQ